MLNFFIPMFKELDGVHSSCRNGADNDVSVASHSKSSKLQDPAAVTFSSKPDFDDGDIDDDLDPAMKEELDRFNLII